MDEKSRETVVIHVNVELSAEALSTIVDISKNLAGRSNKGHYRVDTADAVSRIISRFLRENNFIDYVKDPVHYG